jgi:diaminohydroxyphosphoribosylaminopyrimidine deaminase/5-amino-6-(5-phosphoribosylamino)uracil reductase
MTPSDTDTIRMNHALALAKQALFITTPNPRVGCVITSSRGDVLGEGHTQAAGLAHAEIMALRDAQARGHAVQGATVYVTLEPCAHPQVAGLGFARLRAAGIQVDVGLGAQEAKELNIGFFKRMEHNTPWLRMKSAQSLDGQTALFNGQSQWITAEAARLDGHHWRARACAVLTGIGTVLQDNPLLNVRGVTTPRQPHLLIVDSRLQTPLDARLWDTSRHVVIYHAEHDTSKEDALKAQGAELVYLPGAGSKVDLSAMLDDMGQRAYNEVHIEAGHKLNGSLLSAGLVDELLIYIAPVLLGAGQPMAALPLLEKIDLAKSWTFTDHTLVGADLRVLARPLR